MELIAKTPIFDLIQLHEVKEVGFKPIAVKSNDWVTVVVKKDNRFLTVSQLRFGLMKYTVEFPCGMVENHEDPRDAAVRELQEETGYTVNRDDLIYLGSFAANPAFMTNHMHYFFINLNVCDYQLNKTKFDEHEKITSQWTDKDSFIDSLMNDHDTSSLMAGCVLLLKKENLI